MADIYRIQPSNNALEFGEDFNRFLQTIEDSSHYSSDRPSPLAVEAGARFLFNAALVELPNVDLELTADNFINAAEPPLSATGRAVVIKEMWQTKITQHALQSVTQKGATV